jgi:hypothetical protein
MRKIVKLKDSQLEFREVEKKFKYWKKNENGGVSYRVATQWNSNCLAWVKERE